MFASELHNTHEFSSTIPFVRPDTGKVSWGFGFDMKDYKTKAKMGPRFVFDHLGQFTNRWHFGSFSLHQLFQMIQLARAAGTDSKKHVKDNLRSGLSDVSGGFQAFAAYTHTFPIGGCLWDCVVDETSSETTVSNTTDTSSNTTEVVVINSNETVRV